LPRDRAQTRSLRAYLWQPSKAPGIALIISGVPWVLGWLVLQALLILLFQFLADWLSAPANPLSALDLGHVAWRLFAALSVVLAIVCSPGVLAILVGAVALVGPILYRRWSGFSDAKFDAQLERDLKWLVERGYAKLQLQKPTDPGGSSDLLVLGEPLVLKAGLSQPVGDYEDLEEGRPRWAYGRDGQVRFRLYRMTALYQAQHHIGHYVCEFNAETGLILTETTSESHFKDVTASVTEERSERVLALPTWWRTVEELGNIFKVSAFVLVLTRMLLERLTAPQDFVSRTFSVLLTSGARLAVPYYRGAPPAVDAEEVLTEDAVARMRNLLREKRMSYVRLLQAA
jgi:hypothetical protein